MTATGAVMRRLPAHVELERWYRLLLRAYPVSYRRAAGDEIVATLMDSAEPGRRRPPRADVADLIRGALRQWFRLPVGRLAVVAALLAATVVGALGAAGGSWLAWQTAAPRPSNAAAVRIAETVMGRPLPEANVGPLGLLPEFPGVVYVVDVPDLDWTLEAAQARLRSDGWTLGLVERSPFIAYRGDQPVDATVQTFQATRDGYTVTAQAYVLDTADIGGGLETSVHPTEPRWEPAATVLGWIVGAVIGWLLTGWAGYRLRRRGLPRRLAALTFGLTALALAAQPTIDLYLALAKRATTTPDVYGGTPAYTWIVGNPAAELVAGTLVSGLAILVLAATTRYRPTPRSTPTVA